MSKNSKFLLTFALGAAAGAAVGYLLSSDENKEKIKKAALKIKDTFKDEFDKGKEIVDDLKQSAESFVNEVKSK
jgi:gas vesicle protein